MPNYLFGKAVGRAAKRQQGHRKVLIVGAYPSALHVEWHPAGFKRAVKAVAVDDEPEPFWNGLDQEERIEAWKRQIGFSPAWGEVRACRHLNGSSGSWVDDQILGPLQLDREAAWITDCLDTYFESSDAAARLRTPELQDVVKRLGISRACHLRHPSQSQIVRQARAEEERLLRELDEARPQRLVTLGNAALLVFRRVLDQNDAPSRLTPDTAYGRPRQVTRGNRSFEWIALAHPGFLRRTTDKVMPYKQAHDRWMKTQGRAAV